MNVKLSHQPQENYDPKIAGQHFWLELIIPMPN
jgi:hypothetical protein